MGYVDLELWSGVAVAASCAVLAVLFTLGRPTVSRTALLGVSSSAVLFTGHAAVVDAVSGRDGPARADAPVLGWMLAHRSGSLTRVMTEISAVGGTAGMAVLTVVAAGVLWWLHHRREAVLAVVAAAGAGVLVTVFKSLYARPRPPLTVQLVPETNLSLPSGHALGSAVVLGVIALLVVRLSSTIAVRAWWVGASVTATLLIGVSRLYLGVHWLTDVLTGWLLGGAWLGLCMTVLLVLDGRARALHPRPVPPAPQAREFSWFGLR